MDTHPPTDAWTLGGYNLNLSGEVCSSRGLSYHLLQQELLRNVATTLTAQCLCVCPHCPSCSLGRALDSKGNPLMVCEPSNVLVPWMRSQQSHWVVSAIIHLPFVLCRKSYWADRFLCFQILHFLELLYLGGFFFYFIVPKGTIWPLFKVHPHHRANLHLPCALVFRVYCTAVFLERLPCRALYCRLSLPSVMHLLKWIMENKATEHFLVFSSLWGFLEALSLLVLNLYSSGTRKPSHPQ